MTIIYLLKDLAQESGMSIYTVKYYLKLGIIKEIGRSPNTNIRYFDKGTLRDLNVIRKMRKEKRSLDHIKRYLQGAR